MSYYNGQRIINNNLVLCLDANAKKSVDSMVLATPTGYNSVLFNGVNGYLTAPALPNGPFDLGASDFTMEAWINTNTLLYDQTIVAQHGVGDVNKFSFRVNLHTDGTISLRSYDNQTTYTELRNTSSLAPNTWNHVAITSAGRYVQIFVNGTGSADMYNHSVPQTPSRASLLSIGAIRISDGRIVNHFSGYISNLRIVKGTALYTESFVPTTRPLTNVTGTSLLTCQNSAPIDNSNNNFTINVVDSTLSPVVTSPRVLTNNGLLRVSCDGYFDDNVNYFNTATIRSVSSNTGSLEFPDTGDNFSVQWTGLFTPATTDVYTFYTRTDDASYLWIGGPATASTVGNATVNNGGTHTAQEASGSLPLTASVAYPIKIQYGQSTNFRTFTASFSASAISKTTDFTGRTTYVTSQSISSTPVISFSSPFAFQWKDLSGYNHHARAVSSSLYSSASLGSMSFNGSGSKLIISSSAVLNPTGGGMTFWTDAVPANFNLYNPILFKQNNYTSSGVEQYSIFFSQSYFGCAAVGTDRVSKQVVTLASAANTSYCATINASTSLIKLYVDGTLIVTGSGPSRFDTSSNSIIIGGRVLNSFDFTGSINSVRVYNRVLSDSEVLNNFYTRKPTSIAAAGGDGQSAETAAESAAAIQLVNPSASDGIYWINLPVVGPTRIYCIMDSRYNGGGWMMMMKATRGSTFNYDANYWTTSNTLNPTDLTQSDADAKYDVMNYFYAKDMLARWPDIGSGGSISGLGSWIWLQNNFPTAHTLGNTIPTVAGRTPPIIMFGQASRNFIGDAKLYSGWQAGVFSSQADVRFYGYNFYNNPNVRATRWGFGWNENGGGLYPNGGMDSDDVFGGIGMRSPAYSAGDNISCCQDSTGINRTARVEVYVR